jgi:hypothetical protein
VFTGKPGISACSVVIDSDQATRFPHAIAFNDVFDNGDNGVGRQAGVEKDRSAPFGKALFASPAL